MRDFADDFRVRAADDPAGLLVIVFDVSIASWTQCIGRNDSKAVEEAASAVQSVTEQILIFLNTFMLLHESNRVAIILSGSDTATLVYPTYPHADTVPAGYGSQVEDASLDGTAGHSGKQMLFYDPEKTTQNLRECVVSGVKDSIKRQEQPCPSNETSPITAALAKALCLLNRARRINMAHSARQEGQGTEKREVVEQETRCNGRILIVSAGHDDPKQYVPIMNCIFSAQRIGVLIDSCILSSQDSTYLQQASHLTQGVYIKPEGFSTRTPDTLIQLLQTVFLVDKQSRDFLAMPTPEKVDFRASCLETRKIIEDGYTCSVCLATFDVSVGKGAALCPVCSARFAVQSRPRRRPPKP